MLLTDLVAPNAIIPALKVNSKKQVLQEEDQKVAAAVGMSSTDLEAMYRLLAIAKYDERYVIPPAHAEDAGRLMAQHEQLFCAQPGGPDSFHPPAEQEFRDGDGRLHLNLSPRSRS